MLRPPSRRRAAPLSEKCCFRNCTPQCLVDVREEARAPHVAVRRQGCSRQVGDERRARPGVALGSETSLLGTRRRCFFSCLDQCLHCAKAPGQVALQSAEPPRCLATDTLQGCRVVTSGVALIRRGTFSSFRTTKFFYDVAFRSSLGRFLTRQRSLFCEKRTCVFFYHK